MFAVHNRSRSIRIALLLTLVVSVFGAVRVHAVGSIRYVKGDASGAKNGTSWANAYTDLQSALVAASSGDEIWVAAGTYKPTTGTDRTISFILKNGIAVYGGFAGTETLRAQRDYTTNVTILSGDIGIVGDSNDNSYHVVTAYGTYTGTVLDGFVISDGNANGSANGSSDYRIGGGMYSFSSTASVANVIFRNNSAVMGGGIYHIYGSPSMTNITFSNNSAATGGGLFNQDSNFTMTGVTFSNNSAYQGGGIFNDHSFTDITDATFSGNSASYGAGMYNENYTSPNLTNITFGNNSAIYDGGAIYNYLGSNLVLKEVQFINNLADKGGGVYNYGSDPTFTGVTFSGNSASSGGGMYNYFYSVPALTDATFNGNSATKGGGIYNDVSGSILTNVAFKSNSATDGGGIYDTTNARSPFLKNVVFDSNTVTGSGGGMYNNSNNPSLKSVNFTGNSAEFGGGIYNNNSNPDLESVTFDANTAINGGGMYNNNGSPTLSNLIFSSNSGASGSAIFNFNSSPSLFDITFSANIGTLTPTLESRGGAMVNDSNSSPTLTNVTFANNTVAHTGGAMLNSGNSNPMLVNVTFLGNTSADFGGAIYNWDSNPLLENVTFTSNSAPSGGAIVNDGNSTATIVNSVLYADTGGEIYNRSGSATVTYSIVQGGYAGTGNFDADPKLDSLHDNGGFTQTMALLSGSPAIDAGDNANCPATDQRGVVRLPGQCDIGAYEYVPIVYDDTDMRWSYTGTWNTYNGAGPFNNTLHYTGTVGNTASFTFSGVQFLFNYTQNPNRGSFEVYVDGNKITTINANGTLQWQRTYVSPVYAAGTHVAQFKNVGGSGKIIDVDAIQVLGATIPGEGKYDDSDANWFYSGKWLTYSGSGPANSTLHYTSKVGNTASFTFSGTQFILSYTQNTNRGNFEVYVDGSRIATVNANGSLQWQQTFTSPILAAGTHTAQFKNIGGSGTIMDVDAIQILNIPIPGAGKYDDNENWFYSGKWLTYSGSGPSGSTLHYTNAVGNWASFTFAGTQFILKYTQNTNRGSFEVYVDGGKIATINANGALQWQKTFTSPIFSTGTHVVQVKNIGGSGSITDVDAIEILDTPIPGAGTYDDNDNWFYSGNWLNYSGSGPYNTTLHYTNALGKWASFTFSGTQFTLSYTQNTNRGSFEVYVDGNRIATVNANGILQWQKTYVSPVFSAGTHVVRVKNVGGSGSITDVDAIQIN